MSTKGINGQIEIDGCKVRILRSGVFKSNLPNKEFLVSAIASVQMKQPDWKSNGYLKVVLRDEQPVKMNSIKASLNHATVTFNNKQAAGFQKIKNEIEALFDDSAVMEASRALEETGYGADPSQRDKEEYERLATQEMRFARGWNGTLEIIDDRILRIDRRGFAAFVFHGLKGYKDIGIAHITAIQLKRAKSGVDGYIQFSFFGGLETKKALFDSFSDENTVSFSLGQEDAFLHIKAKIEDLLYGPKSQAEPQPESSIGDLERLEKLAELKEKGIITEEEFDLKKKEILGL